MARKKPHFQWTAEDGEAPPLGERRDRNEARAEREALVAMARRLEALPEGILRQLPIDDAQVEAILHLARLGPQSAHRRQMLRVQKLLRDADLEAIEASLAGYQADAPAQRTAERWRDRLIEHGDEALRAYLDEHPRADRQRLRALIRQARGQGGAAKKAARKLYQALMAQEAEQQTW